MSVCSVEWLLGLLVLSGILFQLPTTGLRQGLLALCNAGFLATLIPDLRSLLVLAVFLLSGFAVARIVMRFPRKSILAGYLVLLIAAFLILKQYAFITYLIPATQLQTTVAVVGLSYIFFRQIHVVVDAYQGQIENLSLWNYCNYQLNLFGFIAGPIQRFQDFLPDWTRMQPVLQNAEDLLKAYLRVFVGILKVTVVGGACFAFYKQWMEAYQTPGELGPVSSRELVGLVGMFYLYPVYIYFNFSGYCDIVIGGARLAGLTMPENFDRPFFPGT